MSSSVQARVQEHWKDYSLNKINVKARPYKKENFPGGPKEIPPHFWGEYHKKKSSSYLAHSGDSEAREIIGSGDADALDKLSSEIEGILRDAFSSINNIEGSKNNEAGKTNKKCHLIRLRLSDNLSRWKTSEHAKGRVLPGKLPGLKRVSAEVIDALGAESWPDCALTSSAVFGCGMTNLLTGGSDVYGMFSNYLADVSAYHEHSYAEAFPSSYERAIEKALTDPRGLDPSIAGVEARRLGVKASIRYSKTKSALENSHKSRTLNVSAVMSRRVVQVICLCDSSQMGTVTEAIARGYEPGGVAAAMVFFAPGTDVVDVGSDLLNSEVMNSFLNTADVTDTGVVSERALRNVYDAFAAVGARILTERWHEPVPKLCALLLPWHIQNDRHMFLRRALLGWPKARKSPARPQREADFDEAFDEDFRATGSYRPLDPEYACNGEESCDRVLDFFSRCERRLEPQELAQLRRLWELTVLEPLEYVQRAEVDEEREALIEEESRLVEVRVFAAGLVHEMAWLLAHAAFHAWQVNYLFEAAMFGSILDGGDLIGKLDRYDQESQGDVDKFKV